MATGSSSRCAATRPLTADTGGRAGRAVGCISALTHSLSDSLSFRSSSRSQDAVRRSAASTRLPRSWTERIRTSSSKTTSTRPLTLRRRQGLLRCRRLGGPAAWMRVPREGQRDPMTTAASRAKQQRRAVLAPSETGPEALASSQPLIPSAHEHPKLKWVNSVRTTSLGLGPKGSLSWWVTW